MKNTLVDIDKSQFVYAYIVANYVMLLDCDISRELYRIKIKIVESMSLMKRGLPAGERLTS